MQVFHNDKIEYFYNANGIKISKLVSETGNPSITTDYAGNYVYKDGNLEFFNHPEGYAEPDGSGGYDYVYQFKDHLGNIRLSYHDTNGDGSIATSEIREENNYYPFGLKHKGYNNVIAPPGDHPYGFGGKEENDELGLAWLDFSARNYDPALGRWMNLDPLAELMTRHSPYNYAFDNPIYFIDADGQSPFPSVGGGEDEGEEEDPWSLDERPGNSSTFVDSTGKIIEHRDDGDKGIYLVPNPENGINKNWWIGMERPGVTPRCRTNPFVWY